MASESAPFLGEQLGALKMHPYLSRTKKSTPFLKKQLIYLLMTPMYCPMEYRALIKVERHHICPAPKQQPDHIYGKHVSVKW